MRSSRDFSESSIDVSAWPVSSCSSLRESRALELLRLDHPPHDIAGHPLGQVDCRPRPRSQGFGEPDVVVREGGGRAELVVRDHDSDRPAAHDQRNEERRAHAHPLRGLLIDLRVVLDRVDPLARPALEDSSRLGAADRERHAHEPVGVLILAVGGGNAKLAATRHGKRDQHEASVDETAEPARDQLEQAVELELSGDRITDLVQRLELAQPAGRALVQASVLDGHRCLRGEKLHELLVLGREVLAALPLGEVEVAVDDAAEPYRNAEERPHRRMVRRKADRSGVFVEIVEPERPRLPDQHTEDASPTRQIADRGVRLGVDSRGHEALEPFPRAVDDPERRVTRAGELGGDLDEPLEQCVERELRAQCDARVDEHAQAIEGSPFRHIPPGSAARGS